METTDVDKVSRTKAWLLATRPMTVPVGVSPILVGAGLAVHEGIFVLELAVASLVAMLLNQQGTHFVNDYYDAIRGIDTDDREGFTRVTQAGLLPAEHVKQGIWVVYALTFIAGIYPVYVGGVPMLVTGVFLAVTGFLYAGPPVYYADNGLGDLAIFWVFGVFPAGATYYLMAVKSAGVGAFPVEIPAGTVPMEAFVAGLAPAGLATAMMIINNMRDRETDMEAGKRTMPVRFGYGFSRAEFVAMLGLVYLAPVVLWANYGSEIWVLLPSRRFPTRSALPDRC
ncbi:1,4-dihydroxy-2-naphthoate octaprenyltransferase [Halorussus caseinilyticus]|uniref:1,4-dihydroxy-2-naphthoate octaprenyltransferase n=1 Tax=Halorussus caseinilyticus TaxID=3034025 RepID=A0ABD5WF10_9EURY